MIRSYKVRLEPSEEQEKMMFQFAGCARFIYNWCLGLQIERYKNGEGKISFMGISKHLTELKKQDEYKWLNECDSIALTSACKDCCQAYDNFFTKQKKKGYVKYSKKTLEKCAKQNRKPTFTDMEGYPKFKAKYKVKPSFAPNYGKGGIKIFSDKIRLPKIGIIKLSRENYIPLIDKYSNPRVTYDGVNWFVSVGVDISQETTELNGSLGVDLGVKDTAICSDGTVYKNINKSKDVKRIEKRLKKLQRQSSRKYDMLKEGKTFKKGEKLVKTKNIIKIEKEINKLHKRLYNIRNNYNHNITRKIVNTNPERIVIEDLNVKGMMKNKHLAESIGKQSFNKISRQLEYKCEEKGIEFVKVDRWYPSSKTCSRCGYIKKDLKLKDRKYKCPECGLEIDRDYNASINLANYKTEK